MVSSQIPIVNSDILPFTNSIATSQTYFYDESGQQLEYQITDVQEASMIVHREEIDNVNSEAVILGQSLAESTVESTVEGLFTCENGPLNDAAESETVQGPLLNAFKNQRVSNETVWSESKSVQAAAVNTDHQVLEVPNEKSTDNKKNAKTQKTKSRKKKFKPTLVTRLKLDANGEMVLDDSSINEKNEKNLVEKEEELRNESEKTQQLAGMSQEDDVLPLYLSPSFIDSALFDQEDFLQNVDIPVDENLNETTALTKCEAAPLMNPSTSSALNLEVEEFDTEAFLNSLDLEKLVLVEAQRDGKDVYEIHEIDPNTEEICDSPMDLPARVVDLIISVMTQQEDDDGE